MKTSIAERGEEKKQFSIPGDWKFIGDFFVSFFAQFLCKKTIIDDKINAHCLGLNFLTNFYLNEFYHLRNVLQLNIRYNH